MFGIQVNSHPKWVQVQSLIASGNCISKPRICFAKLTPNVSVQFDKTHSDFALSNSTLPRSRRIQKTHSDFALSNSTLPRSSRIQKTHFSLKASSASVGSAEYTEEPATKVAFQKSLNLPDCPSSLSLLGTGFREKVFAIVGVKVYAAGFYANPSIVTKLDSWKGQSASEIQQDSSLFGAIFQAPLEKSLQIVLVRDVDGKTFWDALDDAISPRIKSPAPVDESALSTFRSTFQGRSLKKGTFIFLTWLDQSKLLVCVSSDGLLPSGVDATIESPNVTSSLFDVFFGDAPVSPTLKASVSNSLSTILK